MKTVILTTLAVTLALTYAPTTNAELQTTGVFLKVDALGNYEILESVMTPTDDYWTCETTAIGGYLEAVPLPPLFPHGIPVLGDNPACEVSTHPEGYSWSMIIGFPNPNGDVTGTTVVRTESSAGNIEFACDWTGGSYTSCTIREFTGWPYLTSFDITCWSANPSNGAWSCFMDHI